MLFIWLTCLWDSSCYIFFRMTYLTERCILGEIGTKNFARRRRNCSWYTFFVWFISYDFFVWLIKERIGTKNFYYIFQTSERHLTYFLIYIFRMIYLRLFVWLIFSYDLFMGGNGTISYDLIWKYAIYWSNSRRNRSWYTTFIWLIKYN